MLVNFKVKEPAFSVTATDMKVIINKVNQVAKEFSNDTTEIAMKVTGRRVIGMARANTLIRLLGVTKATGVTTNGTVLENTT